MKKVIRLKIHQASAHYRVAFSFQRRFTYPIPPLSTVKGFLCNLAGIKDEQFEDFQNIASGLQIAVYGKYQSIVKEYVWLRNLDPSSHRKKFHTIENRVVDFIPQHPGGQMPVSIDVLNEIDLIIYISHKNKDFQNKLLEILKNPVNRNTVIHLGRSEDWLVFEEIKQVELCEKKTRKIPFFCWLPCTDSVSKDYLPEIMKDSYHAFYKASGGNCMRMPVFYIIKANQRIFNQFVEVKLFEGGGLGKGYEFFVDPDVDNLPVILTDIKRNQNE